MGRSSKATALRVNFVTRATAINWIRIAILIHVCGFAPARRERLSAEASA